MLDPTPAPTGPYSPQHMRRLIGSNVIGVIQCDAEGRILEANQRFLDMVGYTRVSPRVNFTPSISTNSEIQIATITFK